MKTFTTGKAIRRLVTFKSYTRGFPDRLWVLELGAGGVKCWEKGHRSRARLLPWKFVVSQALLFSKSDSPEPRRVNP
jgi:hypothetical protein